MTGSFPLKIAAALLISGPSAASLASDASAIVGATQATTLNAGQLDEIVERGRNLSGVAEKTEDKFFALYNELNKDDQYDVHCGKMRVYPDSVIMFRLCKPGFVVANEKSVAKANEGIARTCRGMTGISGIGLMNANVANDPYVQSNCSYMHGSLLPEVTPQNLLLERRPEYHSNLLDVVHTDQRLIDMMKELEALYEEMDMTQRNYVQARVALAPAAEPFAAPAKKSRKTWRPVRIDNVTTIR